MTVPVMQMSLQTLRILSRQVDYFKSLQALCAVLQTELPEDYMTCPRLASSRMLAASGCRLME